MLVSGVQQSDSVIHIHVSILLQILFPFRLLQIIEQSSLCYTVRPCWLSILNIAVCICQSQLGLFLKTIAHEVKLLCMSKMHNYMFKYVIYILTCYLGLHIHMHKLPYTI